MQFPDARGDGTQSRTTKDVTDANPQITPNSLPEVEKDVTRTRKHFPAHSPMIGGRRPKDVTIFPSAIAEDVTRSRRLVQLSQSGRSGRNVTTMIQALRLEVFNQDRLGSTKDVTGTAADYCEISLQLICNVPPKLEAD